MPKLIPAILKVGVEILEVYRTAGELPWMGDRYPSPQKGFHNVSFKVLETIFEDGGQNLVLRNKVKTLEERSPK